MNRSESIKELATALAKAQAEMAGAKKDADNPHFKSKYADLASVWEAARPSLTKFGLSVVQFTVPTEANEVVVETTVFHSSGEWMSGTISIPVGKNDAHGYGSALTYARRYALAAAVGIAPEDDDGNAATKAAVDRASNKGTPWTKELTDAAMIAASKGMAAYQAWWAGLTPETRSVLVQTAPHTTFKKAADRVDHAAADAAAAKQESVAA